MVGLRERVHTERAQREDQGRDKLLEVAIQNREDFDRKNARRRILMMVAFLGLGLTLVGVLAFWLWG